MRDARCDSQAISRLTVDEHVEGVGAAGLQVADGLVRLEFEDVAADAMVDDEDRGRELGWLEGDLQRRLVGNQTVGLIELVRPAQGSEQLDRTVRT